MSSPIVPFVWFDADPIEIRDYYAGIFDDFETLNEMRGPDGSLLGFTVNINRSRFGLFNGGPGYPHTNALSLMIYTEDQAETDRYWNALIADGGEEQPCGWLNDKFGVKWQITPKVMMEMLSSDDAEGRQRAFNAMLTMYKLDIAELQAAFNGE